MSEDRDTALELAKIATHMEHTQSALIELRVEMKEARREGSESVALVQNRMDELKTEMTEGLTRLNADHSNLKRALEDHAETDRRTFSLFWKVILAGGAAGFGGTGIIQLAGG